MTITSDHIYNRVAKALDEKMQHSMYPVTYDEAEDACERLHENGLNVQTYADAQFVANVIFLTDPAFRGL
jgi:hypothetical protein